VALSDCVGPAACADEHQSTKSRLLCSTSASVDGACEHVADRCEPSVIRAPRCFGLVPNCRARLRLWDRLCADCAPSVASAVMAPLMPAATMPSSALRAARWRSLDSTVCVLMLLERRVVLACGARSGFMRAVVAVETRRLLQCSHCVLRCALCAPRTALAVQLRRRRLAKRRPPPAIQPNAARVSRLQRRQRQLRSTRPGDPTQRRSMRRQLLRYRLRRRLLREQRRRPSQSSTRVGVGASTHTTAACTPTR
jgi:hypothetical protein